jgi:hypothetical protein
MFILWMNIGGGVNGSSFYSLDSALYITWAPSWLLPSWTTKIFYSIIIYRSNELLSNITCVITQVDWHGVLGRELSDTCNTQNAWVETRRNNYIGHEISIALINWWYKWCAVAGCASRNMNFDIRVYFIHFLNHTAYIFIGRIPDDRQLRVIASFSWAVMQSLMKVSFLKKSTYFKSSF